MNVDVCVVIISVIVSSVFCSELGLPHIATLCMSYYLLPIYQENGNPLKYPARVADSG